VGFMLGAIVMFLLLWSVFGLSKTDGPGLGRWRWAQWRSRAAPPTPLNRFFRWAQTASATAMAVGHGMQDAAKTIGIVVLALYTGGFQSDKTTIPQWVFFTSATVLALGTYAGGWRIIRTLGRRIIHLG